MSTDRPEQYPEISGEESGLVPPQGHKGEWPKKIRTLSATDLDRLTIDSTGRFYWDGKLVNYEGQQPQQQALETKAEVDPLDRNALDLLDRAAIELSDRQPPEPAVSAEPPKDTGTAQPSVELRAVDLDALAPPIAAAAAAAAVAPAIAPASDFRPAEYPALVPPAVRTPPERIRISLSGWQSFGVVMAVLGLLIGASGIAAYGWVAAHDWGCRAGVVAKFCPPAAPPAKPAARTDIPA